MPSKNRDFLNLFGCTWSDCNCKDLSTCNCFRKMVVTFCRKTAGLLFNTFGRVSLEFEIYMLFAGRCGCTLSKNDHRKRGFLVSSFLGCWFRGFWLIGLLVSWFRNCMVSWFLVYWFQSFKDLPKFRFMF